MATPPPAKKQKVAKLYSAFFRKFLGSPDKVHATSSKNFKYYWVTEVESDGDWHLIALRANEIRDHHAEILQIAAKLRHAVLFRECIVWLVSDWINAERYIGRIKDRKLQKIAQNAFNTIAVKVSRAQHAMMAEIRQSPEGGSQAMQCLKDVKDKVHDERFNVWIVSLPGVLNCVKTEGFLPPTFRDLLDCTPGTDTLSNRFLCAVVDDEDLPWDITEEDW
ncbi:hypothetical protein L207DRAFT_531242 [Hyaloscypha variabilis F]|uniref:Uncharacterized protein n=1 Tax=Hyaloscypha variabilis (strain UAMH 11265 / GT02V1 / F) TaxID=1149755 RepID=A0A2J6RIJ5_HYAVF|nr:hypothetical protein L207DRAFT_531242 [Hyaloscypha variabilis F]